MIRLNRPTNRNRRALASTLVILSGCTAKPDLIVTVPSPDPNVYYTVESFRGDGPLSSEATNIYAHLNSGGKSDRQMVLHGLYLENARVTWMDPENASICLNGGLTSEYHNKVSLSSGDVYRNIHSHLKENC